MDSPSYQPHFNILYAVVSESTAANNELVAAVENKIIRVLQVTIVCADATSITFKSGSTAISGAMPFAANSGICTPLVPVGLFQTARGEALNMTQADAVLVAGSLVYTVIS